MAAKAIWFAAHSGRKEVIVGAPACQAILGDRIASSLLDIYLGRTSVAAQQDREPVAPDRADNLFQPLPGDRGARGRFSAKAQTSSPLLWATEHRGLVPAAVAAMAAAGALRAPRG